MLQYYAINIFNNSLLYNVFIFSNVAYIKDHSILDPHSPPPPPIDDTF